MHFKTSTHIYQSLDVYSDCGLLKVSEVYNMSETDGWLHHYCSGRQLSVMFVTYDNFCLNININAQLASDF